MEHLPVELLEIILDRLERKDQTKLAQLNKRFLLLIRRLIYCDVMIKFPSSYKPFKDALSNNPELGLFVRRLDFSSFTTKGLKWTVTKSKALINPHDIAQTILYCKNLQELLIGEEMAHVFIEPDVIQAIFRSSSKLQAFEITGYSTPKILFTPGGPNYPPQYWIVPKTLKNISFYMCMGLAHISFFIPFFTKLNDNQLKRLDFGYTRIRSDLFSYMTNITQLTHLNLQSCVGVTCCSPAIKFIYENAATLESLNINVGQIFCSCCINKVLRSLNEGQIKSLDLGGQISLNDDCILSLLKTPLVKPFTHLKFLSLAKSTCSRHVLQIFLTQLCPNLFYLNLVNTGHTLDLEELINILNPTSVQVVEVTRMMHDIEKVHDWRLWANGRRVYYARNGIDPRFVYAKKIMMVDQLQISPMNKYWCYSF